MSGDRLRYFLNDFRFLMSGDMGYSSQILGINNSTFLLLFFRLMIFRISWFSKGDSGGEISFPLRLRSHDSELSLDWNFEGEASNQKKSSSFSNFPIFLDETFSCHFSILFVTWFSSSLYSLNFLFFASESDFDRYCLIFLLSNRDFRFFVLLGSHCSSLVLTTAAKWTTRITYGVIWIREFQNQ